METQSHLQSLVRESTAADRDAIFALRVAVYGTPFDEKEWHWKFEQHSGNPAKVYVAEADGTIVGLRAFVVERLKVFDRGWLTGLGVDIMVHPDYRRYGVATQVANEAAADMEGAGIPILVGFPNEAAFKVYTRRRSNWRHVCSIPFLVKPLNFDSILAKYIKGRLLRAMVKAPAQLAWNTIFRGKARKAQGFEVRWSDDFDERFDDLWEEVREQQGILLVRDRAFLNWRFREKPDTPCSVLVAEREGELLGYIVLWEGRMFDLKVGFILDMLTVNDTVAEALVSQGIQYFKKRGVDAAGCLMLPHTSYFKILRRAGFAVAPRVLLHKEFYFGVQVSPTLLANEIVDRPENWFLTFADLDREVPI